jgi:hypothetical protein
MVDTDDETPADTTHDIMEPRLWERTGWRARVHKNADDDGWAVEMTRIGDSEPALVGPWTMGRDKKNPKPLDQTAFHTLMKTAKEVLRRHEQSARAALHKTLAFNHDDGTRVRADLDIQPSDDDPHAILSFLDDATGTLLHMVRVPVSFKLTATSAARVMRTGEA